MVIIKVEKEEEILFYCRKCNVDYRAEAHPEAIFFYFIH